MVKKLDLYKVMLSHVRRISIARLWCLGHEIGQPSRQLHTTEYMKYCNYYTRVRKVDNNKDPSSKYKSGYSTNQAKAHLHRVKHLHVENSFAYHTQYSFGGFWLKHDARPFFYVLINSILIPLLLSTSKH